MIRFARRRCFALPAVVSALAALPLQVMAETTVQIGVAHLAALNPSNRVRTAVPPNVGTLAAGVPEQFDSEGAGVWVQSTETLALSLGQTISPHWALELDLGMPPVIKAVGRGEISVPTRLGPQLPINLEDPAINPLGKARIWAPALLLQYRILGDCRMLCPTLGVGASYTWFTQESLSPAFATRLNDQYGRNLATLAGKPGNTTATVRVRSTLRPAFAAGLTAAITPNWRLAATAGYVPFSTDAVLNIRASDGTLLSSTRNRMTADAVISSVQLAYHW